MLQKYKILYEKTYFTTDLVSETGRDSYETSVEASSLEEAKTLAHNKLRLIDMRSSYRTDIGNAILITPEGQNITLL